MIQKAKMRLSETDKDTICALATASGLGAISVLRVSGPKAADITRKLAAFLPESLESHKIYYGTLKDVESGLPLDEVLVSYFQHGRSFTGETVFEISCHGSEAVVGEILRNLIAAGTRPANRGEFTFRAFMNGRLDLVQAESVLSLIESKSTRATQLALRQLQGLLSKRLLVLKDKVTLVLAHLEANIDFASEDIEIATAGELDLRILAALKETEELLKGYRQGRMIREGFQIALCGRPNVGKSSLLNALAGEERAIVTPVAGTTRDFVEAELVFDGVRVQAVDTAGLRVTDDPVEKIGIQRALEKLKNVDLVLLVEDASSEERLSEVFNEDIPWAKTLVLFNKCDLRASSGNELRVSATTGEGLENLRAKLNERVKNELSEDSTVVSSARHFQGLTQLRQSLLQSQNLLKDGESPDFIALELQIGLQALYEVLGLTYDDQVMDKVFSEFCLGK